MEKQVVTITVITEGERCEMTDQQIVDWYQEHINSLFNPQYGVRKTTGYAGRLEQVRNQRKRRSVRTVGLRKIPAPGQWNSHSVLAVAAETDFSAVRKTSHAW